MIVAFFSGGRDSAVASHIAYTYSKKFKEEFKLVHVDTKIGIPETKEYIEERKKQRQLTQYLDDTGKNMCMDCLATTLISFLDNDEN